MQLRLNKCSDLDIGSDPDVSTVDVKQSPTSTLFVESSFRSFPVMENDCLIGQISRQNILWVLYEIA